MVLKIGVSFKTHSIPFKKISLLFLSFVLLSSLIPLQSVYSANVDFSSSATNLSNNGNGSITSQTIVSGSDVYVVWRDGNNIFFINSTNSGSSFPDPAVDIGDTTIDSSSGDPQISVSNNDIYVLWRENTDIKFNRSTDGGQNFAGAVVQLSSSTNSLTSTDHDLDSSSNDVYAVWRDLDTGDDDILFIQSGDNGANFGSILDVGDTDSLFPSPQVVSSGTNVYVVWQTSTDILFTRSTNSGTSFGAVTDIGDSSGSVTTKSTPQIAISGSNVFVVWQQNTDIKFAKNSNDGDPSSWDAAVDVGDTNGTTVPGLPKIKASGSNVYIAWRDDTGGNDDIKFRKSGDNGTNFDSEINISNNSGTSTNPQIAVSGNNVFVTWKDSTPSGSNNDILTKVSTDGGDTFGGFTNISDNTGISTDPSIGSSGDSLFVSWTDSTPGVNDILFNVGTIPPIGVSFDQTQYRLGETATVTVNDSSSSGAGSIITTLTSTSDPTGISLTLTESSSGTFTGFFTFTTSSSAGTSLEASPGDTVTASFGGTDGTANIFSRSISYSGVTSFNRGDIVNVEVIDENSNTDSSSAQTISVSVTTNAVPSGITLQLTETGIDTGVFGGNTVSSVQSDLGFMVGNDLIGTASTITASQEDTTANSNAGAPDTTTDTITSTSDPTGITITLTETGDDTDQFTGVFFTSINPSDVSTNTIQVAQGDFVSVTHGILSSSMLVIPNPNPQNGIIQANTPTDLATASYLGASIAVDVLNAPGESGGGGGGLVRPGLVVNLLAGAGLGAGGGGGGLPGPTITLGALSLNDNAVERISMPQEIRDFINDDFDPHTPLEPITTVFEDYELPLSINGNGFALGGYENTLVPQTVKPGESIEFTLVFYTTSEIAHTSLNFNLGLMRTIAGSDTQVLLYKDKFEIVDPNGNIATATGSINNEGDLKRVATFSITFSDDIQWSNSDFVIRSWNDNLNSGDIIVYDAIQVLPSVEEIAFEESIPEPEIETLKSQYVPIWIKNNAAWWSQELIEDSDFVAGIEYLIQSEIITIQDNEIITASYSSNEIPVWIKSNAGWWSEDLITEKEFIDGLQWLINNGIIQVTET